MSDRPEESLAAVAERYGRLVDPRVGVISAVEETQSIPGEPKLHLMGARLAYIDRLYPIFAFDPAAGGTSLDRTEATVRACGEAVERYCGFLYTPDPALYLRHADLPGRGIAPEDWPRCTEDEYALEGNPLAPPDPERRYYWVDGWSLLDHEPVAVPALQAYISYMPEEPDELTIFPNSTGLAAGSSLEMAALSGLFEVLERDAFILTWCKRLNAPRLSVPIDWSEVVERQRRVAECGLELELHALLHEEAPAKVLALIFDRPGGPVPVSCGMGVAIDPRRAVAKAIDEAVQSRQAELISIFQGEMPIPERPEEVCSLEDHVGFYLDPERLKAFDFLRSAPLIPATALPSFPDPSPTAVLSQLVEGLGAQGYEVIQAEITTPDIEAAGFKVVRVIVPGLLPLAHGHAMRFLDCPRWQGYPGPINEWPHPFG
jgi:ribosomal protein S12 methylthiotransferase accessory factor